MNCGPKRAETTVGTVASAVFVTITAPVTGESINCAEGSGDCSAEFVDGDPNVVLTATPAAGFQFASWSPGSCTSSAGNQCTVDMGNDRLVTATFTAAGQTRTRTYTVSVPEDVVGDVVGDLNSRRGRPLGMEAKGSATEIKAEVPMAEVLDYARDLRQITGGRGDYTMEFARHEEIPSHLAQKVISEAKSEEEVRA